MRIAVNTRLLLSDKLDGIGWFSYETLKRICRSHPEHDFFFLFDRKYSEEFVFSENITPIIVRPVTRHPVLWFLWLELSIPFVLKKIKADVFVSPDGFISLRSKIPSLTVIHDINFFHRPKDLPFCSRTYYNYFFPKFAVKANRIGTVSEFSANDIAKCYQISKSKIDVLYNGVNAKYSPVEESVIQDVRKKYTKGFPYFIFVGTLHPRKNIVNMLKGYELFRQCNPGNVKMIIVGEKMFMTREVDNVLSLMKYANDVIFTGRLIPDELHRVLASALAMTFLPFFEGFGIPLIEAMKCGVPVIASRVSSLPEVAGDAALYCDPWKISEIYKAMGKMAENEALRVSLVRKGNERVKKFSWDNSAKKFWNLIEKVLYES